MHIHEAFQFFLISKMAAIAIQYVGYCLSAIAAILFHWIRIKDESWLPDGPAYSTGKLPNTPNV